jgi:hypothetical protein
MQQQQQERQHPAAAEVQQQVKAALHHLKQQQHQAQIHKRTRPLHLVARQARLLQDQVPQRVLPPPLLLLLVVVVLLPLHHLLRRVCCGWIPLTARLSCPPAQSAWSGWTSTSAALLQR